MTSFNFFHIYIYNTFIYIYAYNFHNYYLALILWLKKKNWMNFYQSEYCTNTIQWNSLFQRQSKRYKRHKRIKKWRKRVWGSVLISSKFRHPQFTGWVNIYCLGPHFPLWWVKKIGSCPLGKLTLTVMTWLLTISILTILTIEINLGDSLSTSTRYIRWLRRGQEGSVHTYT